MIIQLQSNISEPEKQALLDKLAVLKCSVTPVKTHQGEYLVAICKQEFDVRHIGNLAGVADVHRVTDAYKLVSKKWKVYPTVIDLGTCKIGGGDCELMMGPCSLEDESQIRSTVDFLASQKVPVMRGGAFKPRTSPYSFRGLGIDGLKMCAEIAHASGIKVISEVMEIGQIAAMEPYVDIYQVGARNTQNFNLLHELGRVDKPVLLKRGMSGTLEELLQSAEYIFANGNEKIILCERGIRTYEKAYRNTLDLNAVPVLKEKSHLPVVVDPSHGIGIRRFVEPMALAAVMAGADGLLIEAHASPEQAASDGDQTLNYEEAKGVIEKVRRCVGVRG